MGTDYSIACQNCKEFYGLHKFRVIVNFIGERETIAIVGKYKYDSNFMVVNGANFKTILTDEINTLQKQEPESWILKISSGLQDFVDDHLEHNLKLYCHDSSLPWRYPILGWHSWKSINQYWKHEIYLFTKKP